MCSQGKENGFIAQCMNKVKGLQGKGFSFNIWTSSNKKANSFAQVKSAPADLCCVPAIDPAQLVRSLKRSIIRLAELEKKNKKSFLDSTEESGIEIVDGMVTQIKELEVQLHRQFCQNREKLRRQCLILALIKGVRAALTDEIRKGNWTEKHCSARSRIMTAICCIEHELSKSTKQGERELSKEPPAITPSSPSLRSVTSTKSGLSSSSGCLDLKDCCTPTPVTDIKACTISSDESTVTAILGKDVTPRDSCEEVEKSVQTIDLNKESLGGSKRDPCKCNSSEEKMGLRTKSAVEVVESVQETQEPKQSLDNPNCCEISDGYDVTGFYLKYTRVSDDPAEEGCEGGETTMAAAEQMPGGSFKITFKTDENLQQSCCEGNTGDFPEFQEKLSAISKAWIESARSLCEELSKLREKSSASSCSC